MNQAVKLIDMKKEKEFLLCVDSDGCAMDTMEYKHREYFGPKMVEIWKLEDIREDVLQVWNHVNLYSQWRGINRFLGLVKVFELLADKKSVKDKGYAIPDFKGISNWTGNSDKLSNAALEAALSNSHDPALEKALIWSKAVNDGIAGAGTDGSPYEGCREALEKAQQYADIVVISSANGGALDSEWKKHGLYSYIKALAGQEMGSKAACISHIKEGKYDNRHVLMVGDSPGDLEAAKVNKVLYYPIIPGKEASSWSDFFHVALDRFINEQYEGEYQDKLIREFNEALTAELPWE